MEEEVRHLAGERHQQHPERGAHRWGKEDAWSGPAALNRTVGRRLSMRLPAVQPGFGRRCRITKKLAGTTTI